MPSRVTVSNDRRSTAMSLDANVGCSGTKTNVLLPLSLCSYFGDRQLPRAHALHNEWHQSLYLCILVLHHFRHQLVV